MSTMQVYASELRKFTYADKAKTVLEAGPDISGVPVIEVNEDLDPSLLVGTAEQEPTPIAEGSRWKFREERAIVESERGGVFAFLTPVS